MLSSARDSWKHTKNMQAIIGRWLPKSLWSNKSQFLAAVVAVTVAVIAVIAVTVAVIAVTVAFNNSVRRMGGWVDVF